MRERAQFRTLERLRNALTHGLRADDKEVRRLPNDEAALQPMLRTRLDELAR